MRCNYPLTHRTNGVFFRLLKHVKKKSMFAIVFPSQLAFSVPSFSLRSTHLSDLTVTMTVCWTILIVNRVRV